MASFCDRGPACVLVHNHVEHYHVPIGPDEPNPLGLVEKIVQPVDEETFEWIKRLTA